MLCVCSKRLTASESLHHHWFTDLVSPMQRPLPTPVRCSEIPVTKMEGTKAKQPSPVTPRKQENITSQSKITATETITVSKSSPSTVSTVKTPSIQRPRDTPPPITKTVSETALSKITPVSPNERMEKFGMSSSRRSRFMKNMENLAQSYMDLSNTKNNNVIESKPTTENTDNMPSSTIDKTESPIVVTSFKAESKSSSTVENKPSPKVENKSSSKVENTSSSSKVENTSSSSKVANTSSSSKVENMSSSKVESTSSNVDNDKSSNVDNAKSPSKENNNNITSVARIVNKATAMQTMPVNGIDGYKFNHSLRTESQARRLQQNLNLTDKFETEVQVPRRVLDNKDCVYTFRKCFIIDDSEDDGNHGATPVIIHGTTMTTENGHSYSDHSSSDSGSDSVSEMSIDSSSDRSSIISLDDSLLEYNYTKINGRPYPGINYVSCSTTSHNVWDSSAMLNVPRTDRSSRHSYSETFSRAFARFNSVPGDKQEEAIKKSQEKNLFTTTTMTVPRKQYAKAAHTSVLNKVLMASISSSEATATTRKVDFLREHNGNIVIIRELKAGKYSRVSEVKCESVQSRIKKLQVQGGKS